MSLMNFLPLLITAFGFYFLVRLRFFFVRRPVGTLKKIGRLARERSSRRSLSLALAGTLGVGNIAGVAYGISVGGAGCLFWIFVSGIFSSVIKYAESTLAADMREGGRGGMTYVLSHSFGKVGKSLGTLYALLCLLLSLSMGAALQSSSTVAAVPTAVAAPGFAVALVFAILCAAVIFGGSKKIESAASVIIPIATIIYILICVSIIVTNISHLPSVLSDIISGAFNFKSATGGVSAFIFSKAVKEGYARGLLSNEAGAGTSAMAQTRSRLSPPEVGLLGVCEVLFDTTLLCMLTGFAVLLSGVDIASLSGMQIVTAAVSATLGRVSGAILFIIVFAFAYSTVVCWYYYGCECLYFLFGRERSTTYITLFLFFTLIGFLMPQELLISTADTLLFGMSLLTLAALIKNSERIVYLSEQLGLLKYSDRGKKRISHLRNDLDS